VMSKWHIEVDAFGAKRYVKLSVWRRFKLFCRRYLKG
jgi:hypothetical protein